MIIVTYNGRHYLDPCLRSLLDQLGPDDEVIVVDNASTDGTAHLVEQNYPEVHLVRNAANRGFAAACNQGAELASGQVLLFLNQDTRVAPGWLEGLVQGLDSRRDAGLVTSQVRMMASPDQIQACGQDVHYAGLVFARGFSAPAGSLDLAQAVGAVAGCSFAARRDVWQELGGFDETLYMYYEETDLSWRARLRGYRSVYLPDSVVYHDYQAGRPTPTRLYHSARNRRIMLLKNWRWPTLALLAPSLLLAEIIEWIRAFTQGWRGLKAKARADLWLVSHLRLIYRLHADAQTGREISDAEILSERTLVIQPQEMTMGVVGRAIMAIGNAVFALNHHFAQVLCRLTRL